MKREIIQQILKNENNIQYFETIKNKELLQLVVSEM